MTTSRQLLAPTVEPEVVVQATITRSDNDRIYLVARLLWEQRRFFGRWTLRGALASLLIAFLVPAAYESKTSLVPPDPQSGLSSILTALGGESSTGSTSGSTSGGSVLSMAAGLLGLKTSSALFISILTSDSVEDNVINRLDLRKVYWVRTYRDARKDLQSHTDIREDKKSGVITITVTDRDPQRAAAIARIYVEELNRMVTTLNTSGAHRERVFLEDRLRIVKQELDQSARDFSDFSSKNTAIDIKEQGRAMVEAAATLQGQEIAAESELRGLEQIYTPTNVRVRAALARIAELQRQLQKLGGAASFTEANPESAPALYPSIRQLPKLGLTYADLYRTLKINETLFEVLTKEYELAKVQEAKEIPSVKVLDPAKPPERRAGPSRLLICLSGVVFSFSLAAIWILAGIHWNNTDLRHPGRMLAQEISSTISRSAPWKQARRLSLRVVRQRFRNGSNHNHHPD